MADINLNEVTNVADLSHALVVNGTQVGKMQKKDVAQKMAEQMGMRFFKTDVCDLGQHTVIPLGKVLNRLCICHIGGYSYMTETIELNNPDTLLGGTTTTTTFISDSSKTHVPGQINLVQDDYGNLHIYGGLDSINEFTYFRVIDLETL